MNKFFVGVDPGKSGYMVVIVEGEVLKFPYPLIGKEYDAHGMLEMFKVFDPNHTHVIIEDVKALQKPFQAGNWSLSRGKTILEMSCIACKLPFTMVHPKTWQKEIWQGVPIQTKSTGK